MVFRLLFAVVALTAIGAGTLALRQQDRVNAREMSACHNTIHGQRVKTRTLQTQISAKTSPESIAAACKRAKLRLEPVKAAGQILPEAEAPQPAAAGSTP